ncbi:MAG: hypothetical protein KAU58_04330, partial [Candidatus Omnitrophica bacterium]|nr:hypothetical protein [Candidatus Omnitrophota bacterium]
SKLLKSIELEEDINFRKANEERKFLIDELSRILPKRDLEKLVLESLSFKMGKISQGEFQQYLIRLSEDAELSPKPYSNLIRFTRYITIYEDIDLIKLFSEVEEFEDYIREKIFRNDEEKELYNLTKTVRTIKKLFEISLSNNDYNFIISKKRYFNRALLSEFIRKSYLKYKLPFRHEYDLDVIFDSMDEAIQFYNIAQKRNNAMISNTIEAMRQNNEQVVALITGGFHSKGLAGLLKEKGLSYLVIMPKFKEGDERPYLAILTNKRQPYEELLETGEYILAVRAYFYTGSEHDLKEAIFYSIGRAYDEGMPVNPLLKRWLKLFTYDYYAFSDIVKKWAGEGKRPITPKQLADLFGFKLKLNFTQDGKIKSVEITEDLERETGFWIESVRVGSEKIIVVKQVKDGITEIEIALTKGEDGKYNIDLVPPQAKRILKRRSKEAKKEIGRQIEIEITRERIAEQISKLLDLNNANTKAERDEIKALVIQKIKTPDGKSVKEGINIENLVARVIKSKGYRLPKDWRSNKELAEAIGTFAEGILPKSVPEETSLKNIVRNLSGHERGEISNYLYGITNISTAIEKLFNEGQPDLAGKIAILSIEKE